MTSTDRPAAPTRDGGAVVLLRHGQSTANAASVFTGRHDVGLTDLGEEQARRAGRMVARHVGVPGLVLTSPMRRARRTAELLTDAIDRPVPVRDDWRLVERDYGCLTGMAKHRARTELGPEGFVTVRRTRHGRPAPLAVEVAGGLDLYEPGVPELVRAGAGESLDDVVRRVAPLWPVVRDVARSGGVVVVVAHGNSLRALSVVVDGLDDDEVLHLNLPAGEPLVYRVGPAGEPAPRGGTYLAPGRAEGEVRRIAAEGGT